VRLLRIIGIVVVLLVVAWLAILDMSYTPRQKFGRCRIVGDHETVADNCVPYCPPRPSECG
jgi:hypothetical protein